MRVAPLSIVACLLTAVAAQSGPTSNPPTTPPNLNVTAGKSSTFTWTPTTSGTVTLTLRNGPANDLNKGTVLASGIDNSGSYTFTVPADTVSGSYTIEISSDSNANDANYSDNITVEGSNSVESASPSLTTSTTVASSSTSSSSTSSSTDSRATSTTPASETSTTSSASTSNSSSSSSTSGTKSASSASGTSAPTSSKSTPTGSSNGASAGTALSFNQGILAIILGILGLF